MQVNFNTQNNKSNLNFGAMHKNKAAGALWWRARDPEVYQAIQDIVDTMRYSPVEANVYGKKWDRLAAVINEHNGHGYTITESWWDRIFHSPVKFFAELRDTMIDME